MPNHELQAIDAVFYARVDLLREIVEKGNFPKEQLNDIGLLSEPFPIWRIPQCWKQAIGNKIEDYTNKEVLAAFAERNNAMMEYFHDTFGVEYTPIDYQKYWEDFYSQDPAQPDDAIIPSSKIEVLRKRGTTQLDVGLYCAAVKFDYARVVSLLQQGASPYAAMEDSDWDDGVIERIGGECSFLRIVLLDDVCNHERGMHVEVHDIKDLVGWAAHEKMHEIIGQYNTVQLKGHIPHTRKDISDMIQLKMKADASVVVETTGLSLMLQDAHMPDKAAGEINIIGPDDLVMEI